MQINNLKTYFPNLKVVNSDINKKGILTVKNTKTGKFYVQKILTDFDIEIYKYLHLHPIKNIPEIIDYIENDSNLIILEEYIEGITLRKYLNNFDKNFDYKIFYNHIYKLCDIINALQNAKDSKTFFFISTLFFSLSL